MLSHIRSILRKTGKGGCMIKSPYIIGEYKGRTKLNLHATDDEPFTIYCPTVSLYPTNITVPLHG